MSSITDIADEIYREMGEPDDISIPSISFWLSSNIGQLNTLINVVIEVDENEEFVPELTHEQKAIFKQIYFINYFTRMIKTSLGASAYDWSELSEGDSRIRRVSRNEIAKTYQQVRGTLQTELSDLVFFYKQNRVIPYSISSISELLSLYRFI